MKKMYYQLVIALLYFLPVFSQPGSLDQNFGTGGKVFFNFSTENSNSEFGKKSFLLSGGKTLIVFQVQNSSFMAVRLMSDGSIDNSYGQGGYSEILENLSANNCAMQSDEKLVISGVKFAANSNGGGSSIMALGRLTPGGLIDDTFDGDGIVVFNNYIPQQQVVQLLIQPDGKILMGDYGKLRRVNADGSLDNSFGINGVVTTPFVSLGYTIPTYKGLFFTSQDKIIAVGYYYNYYQGNGTLVIRYNLDGSLDNTFDVDGIALINYNLSNNIIPIISSATLHSDGKLLLTGTITESSGYPYEYDAFIARVLEDGSLDPSFNAIGSVIADIGSPYDDPTSIYSCSDGKILICGGEVAAGRFNPDGSLDSSFGNNGIITPLVNGFGIGANNIVSADDEQIYVAGYSQYTGSNTDCLIMKFDVAGIPDNAFNGDGIVTLSIDGSDTKVNDIFKLNDGKVMCIGNKMLNYPSETLCFARFLSDGSPDNTFGDNGVVETGSGPISSYQHSLMLADEKYLVPSADSISRFSASGQLDATFSSPNGILTLPPIPGYNNGNIYSMAIQADGSILVLIITTPQSGDWWYYNYALALFRFFADGTIDSSFGTNGVQVIPAGYSTSPYYQPRGFSDAKVMIREDGKIVVAGSLMLQSPNAYLGMKLFLSRFNSNGSFDSSFDGDGILLTTFSAVEGALTANVLSDNKILVNYSGILSRFNENGILDNSFGTAGSVNTNPNVSFWNGNIVIQEDGKIIKKGNDNSSPFGYYLSRYNPNGSPDNTFGINGNLKISGDPNFGPYLISNISIFDDVLFLGGYVIAPIPKGTIHKYWLSDVQLYGIQDVTAATVLGSCSVAVNDIDPVLSPENSTATVNYTLTGATTGNGTGSVSGLLFNTGVTTVTYTLANDPNQICSFTVTVIYPVTPAMTISTSAVANNFCNGILLTANSNVPIQSYSWSNGVTTQTNFLTTANASGTYSVDAIAAYGCPLVPSANYTYNNQALTSSYTLLAKSSIKLEQNNTVVNGSVGVVNTNGSASMKKNVSIAGPGAFLKAKNISLQSPYNIPIKIYAAAAVTLPTMQYNTTSTSGLPNVTVPNGTTITITGNRKNVTIGSNCNVTLTGSIFSNISIGEKSKVLFTQSLVNVVTIDMKEGSSSTPTLLRFSGDAIVRSSGDITVRRRSAINPENYKVIFYIGKPSESVDFTVKGNGNIIVNASMYIPKGMLSVEGDDDNNTYMNGKFIAEKIETLDKNVIWNWYDCAGTPPVPLDMITTRSSNKGQPFKPEQEKQAADLPDEFTIKAWPNPSDNQFTLSINSNSDEPVEVKVFDMSGRQVYSTTGSAAELYQFGDRFSVGTYVVMVRQGPNSSTAILIKQQ